MTTAPRLRRSRISGFPRGFGAQILLSSVGSELKRAVECHRRSLDYEGDVLMSRPGSRFRSKKPYALPVAGPKTLKIKEGKTEPIGFRAPSLSKEDEIPSILYTINNADDQTYISMLKSDIYQIQRKLDKVQRILDQMLGSRPQSARGREIRAIAEATSEVDSILKSSRKASHCKLRLQELLNEKMVQLETVVLRLADSARIFRNVSCNYGAPSMSRLPAFLELVDQVMILHKLASRTPMHLDSDEKKMETAPLPNALKALEKCLVGMGEIFGVEYPDISGQFSAGRVATAAKFVLDLESNHAKLMKNKISENETTILKLKSASEGLHDQLKKALGQVSSLNEELSTAHKEVKSLKDKARNPVSPSGTEENKKKKGEEIRVREDNFNELKDAYESLKSELERARKKEGERDEKRVKEVESVRSTLYEEVAGLKRQLAEKSLELSKKNQRLADFDARAREEMKLITDSQTVQEEMIKKANDEARRLREDNILLNDNIKILKEKNEVLEGKSNLTIDEALRLEVKTANDELLKRKRTLNGLDMYMRDMMERKEMEFKQLKDTISKLKFEVKKEKQQREELPLQ
ncbi:hypothetical protein AAMO2058_001395700 [Amorphochlora amoebiformis]